MAKDQFWSFALMSLRPVDTMQQFQPGGYRKTFFLARNALYHSLSVLDVPQGAQVLVPSYVCRAAVDPLRARGVEVVFYPTKLDCSTDVADIEQRITARTRAVMIVHYFGFPQPVRRIRELCEISGLKLIEDCAHVLSGRVEGKPIGSIGDAAVFSWRKFLPIFDGAELVMNIPVREPGIPSVKESPLFTLKVAFRVLEAALARGRDPIRGLAYRSLQLGAGAFRQYARRYDRHSGISQVESDSVEFDLDRVNLPMSRLSRWIRTHSDIEDVVAKRRRNYRFLLDEFATSDDISPVFPELPPTTCPWVFPAIIPGLSSAHRLLRRKGIPAVTWSDVRHPSVPIGRFRDADFLYENLLFLPVHQCLKAHDMVRIVEAVRTLRV